MREGANWNSYYRNSGEPSPIINPELQKLIERLRTEADNSHVTTFITGLKPEDQTRLDGEVNMLGVDLYVFASVDDMEEQKSIISSMKILLDERSDDVEKKEARKSIEDILG